MKILNFDSHKITVEDPSTITFENQFDDDFYKYLYNQITNNAIYQPTFNTDDFFSKTVPFDVKKSFDSAGLILPPLSNKATNRDRLKIQHMVRNFFGRHTVFAGMFQNNITLAEPAIKNAELIFGSPVDSTNFIQIKGIIDKINRGVWKRDRDTTESQSGVSTLGTISEKLLEKIFVNLIKSDTFFKVNQSDVQSYGDFVLMCLPNNLWLSVKSNFARERLLASGYSNDIIGVGFFQESSEFTNKVRVRNFQRAGFLAMYCPDISVSQKQLNNNTNTYDEIIAYYKSNGVDLPTNINGKPFIRKLSDLYDELSNLLNEPNIQKRLLVDY